ncbi:MAG TPA: hypothetical protein VM369_08140 [Candidatus Binatia bacterium]|nr:hypothetical protein [Candidatus Binatia bacterium]
MKSSELSALRGGAFGAFATLLLSSSTLLCCALPALLVALGAGATLAGLVTAVPQLVWLSAHKGLVFGGAGAALAVAGVFQWRARSLPCPADPALAAACARTRRFSVVTWFVAVAIYAIGATFAFLVPLLA